MLTPEMRTLIEENTLGLVATVTPDGKPAVSPKATTVVLSPNEIAFLDIRSPKTRRNVEANPNVELNYVDVFRRTACRLTGTANYINPGSAEFSNLRNMFKEFEDFLDGIHGIFQVTISNAQIIVSPAYDGGAKENDLKTAWLSKYTELLG